MTDSVRGHPEVPLVVELSGDAPESVIDGVIAELLITAPGSQPLTDSPTEHDAAVTEVVEAATRHVFAPDPLADPSALSVPPAPGPPPVAGSGFGGSTADPATVAADAAAAAGVSVRLVDTHVDVAAAVSVLDAVFAPESEQHFYPPSLLRNMLAAGAPLLAAWDENVPVGVILALPGWSAQGNPLVQSGPMAVVPVARGRGIAVALKLAQRTWAMDRSVTEIRWTFDALSAASAQLNLYRLRARVEMFLPGYEGIRDADTPTPLPYDRLLVAWHLDGPGHGDRSDRAPESSPAAAWAVSDDDGLPLIDPEWGTHPEVLVAVPRDIGPMRRAEPQIASAWQRAVGGTLRDALALGWEVTWAPRSGYRIIAPDTRSAA